VLSSVIEGFPNVLLEAMAMARPVVATEVGGIPELIHSGEDGILVPPRDGKALAGAVLDLLHDREKAKQMALRGQEKIRRDFNLKRMIDDYESLYLSLLEKKGSGRKQRHPEEARRADEGSRSFAEQCLNRRSAQDDGLGS
jgi:glycosyltransferase involved in cell wall biosynthesis